MLIRKYQPYDTQEIMQLFYDTIHTVNVADYSEEQVNVWAPEDMNFELWEKGLSQKMVFVAEENNQIIGFGELEENGHIDCFYCHKDYQRKGVGSKIFDAIESKAKSLKIDRLFTEASITARPFFESKGFKLLKEQKVEYHGVTFKNYAMEKVLNSRQ